VFLTVFMTQLAISWWRHSVFR